MTKTTNKTRAENLLRLTLERVSCDTVLPYQAAFFAGQIQVLIGADPERLFDSIRQAFLDSQEDPERLPLYLDDISAGLASGRNFPIENTGSASTITRFNPLRVTWHRLPPWLALKLRVQYRGRGMTQKESFSYAVMSSCDPDTTDLLQAGFDHFGMDHSQTLLVTEPYLFNGQMERNIEKFCQKIGASYQVCIHPWHHSKCTRVEIAEFSRAVAPRAAFRVKR